MDRGVLFFGKFLANWIFLMLIDLVTLSRDELDGDDWCELRSGWDEALVRGYWP